MAITWGHCVRAAVLTALLGTANTCYTEPAWAATDEERAAARSLAEQGIAAFSEQRFQDAVDLFSRAETVVHSPVHLLYIARASAQLGNLVKAQEAYVKITREELPADAPDAFKSASSDAATELETLRPRIPHLTVHIKGAGDAQPELFIDGEPVPPALVGVPMPVDPGNRKLEARAEGTTPATQEVALAEGQKAELDLELTPAVPAEPEPVVAEPVAPPPKESSGGNDTLRYASYGAFGVGAIGLIAGGVFAYKASSTQGDADDLFSECDPDCTSAQQKEIADLDDDAASDGTLSLTGFIVGGVGVGAGVVLYLLSSGDDESATNEPRITPWIGYNSAGIAGTF